jgi:hypothetical protein
LELTTNYSYSGGATLVPYAQVSSKHPYQNSAVYVSENIHFGTNDTGSYELVFSSSTATENGYDFLDIYENSTEGALLYSRSGSDAPWPRVVVFFYSYCT